jgi:hypothetical protein
MMDDMTALTVVEANRPASWELRKMGFAEVLAQALTAHTVRGHKQREFITLIGPIGF